jgi:hypothetical protein
MTRVSGGETVRLRKLKKDRCKEKYQRQKRRGLKKAMYNAKRKT